MSETCSLVDSLRKAHGNNVLESLHVISSFVISWIKVLSSHFLNLNILSTLISSGKNLCCQKKSKATLI